LRRLLCDSLRDTHHELATSTSGMTGFVVNYYNNSFDYDLAYSVRYISVQVITLILSMGPPI